MPLDHVRMIKDLWPENADIILFKYHEQVQLMYDHDNAALSV